MGYRVAVVGATGAVGREMLKTLAERRFPIDEVAAVASGRSAGAEVSFGEDRILKVRSLDTFDFRGWDIGLFSPGASVSATFAPRAAAAGCVVIDNTSQFRMDPDVPLVVPEVNKHALAEFGRRNIIANPNCSTIQMVVALKPLHDEWRIRRVVVATYQSVSGAGKEAMDELFNHTKSVFVHESGPPEQFIGRQARIQHLLGRFHPRDRQAGRIEKSELNQDRSLVPVNVFVGQFPLQEVDDDDHGNFHPLARGRKSRQHPVHRHRVAKAQDDLVHQAVGADGP